METDEDRNRETRRSDKTLSAGQNTGENQPPKGMEEGKLHITDRISELPEDVIRHIMSFVEVEDVVNTCINSYCLTRACATLQFLSFGENFFPWRDTTVPIGYRYRPSFLEITNEKLEITNEEVIGLVQVVNHMKIAKQKLQERMNTVDGRIVRLQHHKVDLIKFCLYLPSYGLIDLEPYIYKLVSSLVECKIQELVFKVKDRYTLPGSLYTANSLRKLHLTGFKLESPSDGLRFPSLRELNLSCCDVEDKLLQLLTMSCPELEFLNFKFCCGFDSLQIFGLPKLKKVTTKFGFKQFNKIEIQAPKLEHLSHHSTYVDRLCVVDVAACKSLKVLILQCITITPQWVNDIFSMLPLEVFELSDCEGLKNVRITSTHLKQLSLAQCMNLNNTEVDAPNLSSFSYVGVIPLRISLKASALEDIHLCIFPETSESQWHSKLIEFLGSFNHYNLVELIVIFNPDEWIIPKYLRETLQSPLYDIKHLTVNLQVSWMRLKDSILLDLLDSFLWLAPCLDSLSVICGFLEQTVELIHETSAVEGKEKCCASAPFRCWRCSLKEVNFKNFQSIEYKSMVKHYFVENARILKKRAAEGLRNRDL
ncbi:hypothetical protein ACH5RR_028137 [Cinchona calisaya]|uniref:F-box/LRR-repeat protein 15/At3g58940/PEG3-like LRR domain-containing protein n=1 Tax=Cinchona calisaya TaxID=153742 RepID=A0ABD2YQ27_9GENT